MVDLIDGVIGGGSSPLGGLGEQSDPRVGHPRLEEAEAGVAAVGVVDDGHADGGGGSIGRPHQCSFRLINT